MTGAGNPAEPDGPWRIAARLRVLVLAEAGDLGAAARASRIGTALGGAGIPIFHARAAARDGLAPLLPRPGEPGFDVLMLDAGCIIAPADVMELRRVADTDPMLAAVMPRFVAPEAAPPPLDLRPAVTYAVLPDCRCLYLKGSVLAGFEPTLHGPFGEMERRLLSLNRLGFRVAVANRAVARHADGPSSARLGAVPPDWRPVLARHASSAPQAAEALLSGLLPGPDGRRAVAFDLAHVGPSHSGTTRLAGALIRRAAARWNDCALYVVASPAAFAFHLGDLGAEVTRIDPAEPRIFAALIRFGQPFLWKEIDAAVRRAPVLVLFLLDTIGLDSLRDAPDELDALWRFMLAEADGVLFNSAFTERQFTRRFAIRPDLPRRASLHSLDLADYRDGNRDGETAHVTAAVAGRGSILVIGNGLPHKYLRETAALLAAAGLAEPIVVLGLEPGTVAGVTALPSGGIGAPRMAELYADAAIVVYPSVYEGFGFPVLEALSWRRPILVRPLPPYAEIADRLPAAVNVHGFSDDADLVRQLRRPPVWVDSLNSVPLRTWDDAADDLRAVLDEALAGADEARVVRRIDILRGRMPFMRARALAAAGSRGAGNLDDAAAEDLDRLAGLAGRLAQAAVMTIGLRVPGGRALLKLICRALLRRPRARR